MRSIIVFMIFVLNAAQLVSAGAVESMQVEIDLNMKRARGVMISARKSPDSVQRIRCGGNSVMASCVAVDRFGLMKSCTTTTKANIDVLQSLTAYSLVEFHFDDNGTCTAISVTNDSAFLP